MHSLGATLRTENTRGRRELRAEGNARNLDPGKHRQHLSPDRFCATVLLIGTPAQRGQVDAQSGVLEALIIREAWIEVE